MEVVSAFLRVKTNVDWAYCAYIFLRLHISRIATRTKNVANSKKKKETIFCSILKVAISKRYQTGI